MSSVPSYQAGKNIGTLVKLATDPIVSQQQSSVIQLLPSMQDAAV